MPDSARQKIPSFGLSEYVIWGLGFDSRFLSAFGTGLARIGLDSSDLVGQHVSDVYEDRPDLLSTFRKLMQGSPINTCVEYGGTVWYVEATPDIRDGQVVGASGVSFVLEKEDAVEAVRPRERVWELAGVPEEPEFDGYWSADRFFRVEGEPGAMMTRYIPDGEFARLLTDLPKRMHLIHDSGPSASSRRLRLLR